MGHTGASVMRQHIKRVKTQALHQNHLVLRHVALGIGGVVGPTLGFGRIAITPQVGRHHAEMPGQSGGHLVPNCQGLRVPVQQQQARALATQHGRDVQARGDFDLLVRKTGKQGQGRVVHGLGKGATGWRDTP